MFLTGAFALAQSTVIAPIKPKELTDCGALFARIRAAASSTPVSVQWSTSYLARGTRFMGVTTLSLSPRNDELFGSGKRARHLSGEIELQLTPPGASPILENMNLTIRADDTMVINEIYGPYAPLCTGDRFAIVLSGDSAEVFTFLLPTQ